MRTIYKYKLLSSERQQLLQVPIGATPLQAGLDTEDIPCVWFLIPAENKTVTEKVLIATFFAGEDIPDGNLVHLGTYTRRLLVLHTFLVLPPS